MTTAHAEYLSDRAGSPVAHRSLTRLAGPTAHAPERLETSPPGLIQLGMDQSSPHGLIRLASGLIHSQWINPLVPTAPIQAIGSIQLPEIDPGPGLIHAWAGLIHRADQPNPCWGWINPAERWIDPCVGEPGEQSAQAVVHRALQLDVSSWSVEETVLFACGHPTGPKSTHSLDPFSRRWGSEMIAWGRRFSVLLLARYSLGHHAALSGHR